MCFKVLPRCTFEDRQTWNVAKKEPPGKHELLKQLQTKQLCCCWVALKMEISCLNGNSYCRTKSCIKKVSLVDSTLGGMHEKEPNWVEPKHWLGLVKSQTNGNFKQSDTAPKSNPDEHFCMHTKPGVLICWKNLNFNTHRKSCSVRFSHLFTTSLARAWFSLLTVARLVVCDRNFPSNFSGAACLCCGATLTWQAFHPWVCVTQSVFLVLFLLHWKQQGTRDAIQWKPLVKTMKYMMADE